MLSQGRHQLATLEPVSFLLFKKSLWLDGLNEMCLTFVLLKPLVGGEKKEEKEVGERNAAQMAGAFLIVPGYMGGVRDLGV
jgi:hypothetical protein